MKILTLFCLFLNTKNDYQHLLGAQYKFVKWLNECSYLYASVSSNIK